MYGPARDLVEPNKNAYSPRIYLLAIEILRSPHPSPFGIVFSIKPNAHSHSIQMDEREIPPTDPVSLKSPKSLAMADHGGRGGSSPPIRGVASRGRSPNSKTRPSTLSLRPLVSTWLAAVYQRCPTGPEPTSPNPGTGYRDTKGCSMVAPPCLSLTGQITRESLSASPSPMSTTFGHSSFHVLMVLRACLAGARQRPTKTGRANKLAYVFAARARARCWRKN
jgi:hypothetical protein